jgi:type IV pilus assembly protein PilO
MTSSQPPSLGPLLLVGVPAALGGVLALLVLALGSGPLISQLQIQGRQHQEQRAQQQRLPQLRADLRRLASQQQQAERQQQRLLQLIAGSGELVTFMAQVDREAQRHGVQLQLIEPLAAIPAADPAAADPLKGQAKGTRNRLKQQADQQEQAGQGADPLQKAGLKARQLLISARGRYPNLLAFVRSLEGLGLLVVQSNLNLSQPLESKDPPPVPPVELKLALSLYSPAARP